MERPCAQAFFAESKYTLPGWTTELLLPVKGADEQQKGIQAIMKQILENQRQQWEVQRYLQNCMIRLIEEQQYVLEIPLGGE